MRSIGGGRPETRDPRPLWRSRRTGGVDAKHRGWETRDPRPATLVAKPQDGYRSPSAVPHTVSVMRRVTTYGSMLALGRRSSM